MVDTKRQKYSDVCRDSNKTYENNDCAVKAIAMTCRMSYDAAHTACKENGRPNRKGMYTHAILKTAEKAGFRVEKVEDEGGDWYECGLTKYKKRVTGHGGSFTPGNMGRFFKEGHYLCFVKGHVFPLINGEVYDWSEGRRHRVTSMYRVVRAS